MLPVMGRAQALPATLTDTVSDCADLLTPAKEDTLTATFKAARGETGVHITLAIMGGISDFGGAGQRIESDIKKLFNAWGVGDKMRHDGVLTVIARPFAAPTPPQNLATDDGWVLYGKGPRIRGGFTPPPQKRCFWDSPVEYLDQNEAQF